MSIVERVGLFRNDLEAVFVRRPNRFLVEAKARGRSIFCHCPNPGRLLEMFFPGARLILEKRPAGGVAKTAYTAAGIYYRDSFAPLVSARANIAAEKLILKKIIPGLREIRREFTMGDSRFDFLCLDSRGMRHLVEVKACSLVEYGVAMFPDAPSGRALKHLEELASLCEKGYRCHVLFVIVHSRPKVFVPNLHTDPEFASALSRYAKKVKIHAALVCCDKEGGAKLVKSDVPVDLSHGSLAEKNCGSYLIVIELARAAEIEAGSLGRRVFQPGWYVYAGSAMKNLNQRISRHVRKIRKQKHWHLDYLTPFAKSISPLPVRSYRNLECELAAALRGLGGRGIPGFGCSDCRCESHLYYFKTSPLGQRGFVDMLFRFRHVEGPKQI
jgi:sugar fermentation stimulation protein A